uniref:Uncharacterized protein n=1 Tax=Globodera rostochiensis TaxID=31243 RepID=A0A914IB13_GLORO
MSSNLGSSNSSSEQQNNGVFQPAPVVQPWYPNVREHVFTNERRPGRLTKREKKRIQASLLPVLANPDDGKEYCVGGKYAKPVEQRDAECAAQVLEEKAFREQEKREKMAAFLARNGHTAATATSDNGTVFAASAAAGSSTTGNASDAESAAAGNGTGSGGGGTGVRLSYGGMRGVGRARGWSGR